MKEILLTAFLTVGLVFLSCERCPEVEDRYFNITDYSMTNYAFQETENEDRQLVALSDSDTIPASEYRFILEGQRDYLAAKKWSASFNSLFALDCEDRPDIPLQNITAIYVETMVDYNDRYKAGDTLNPIVQYYETVPFYQRPNDDPIELSEALESTDKNEMSPYAILTLNHQFLPADTANGFYKQELRITVQLDNNASYTQDLESVYLFY